MTLVFVYNANSGFFNALSDWTHKLLSPETYACNLCALTYSNVGMRREWRKFIEQLQHPVEFLHRDELAAAHSNLKDMPLPAIFKKEKKELKIWLSADDLNRAETLSELQALVTQRLAQTAID